MPPSLSEMFLLTYEKAEISEKWESLSESEKDLDRAEEEFIDDDWKEEASLIALFMS